MTFQGYTQETVDFLWGIRFNNERGWFMDHKQDYQDHLLSPTRALAEQVYDAIHEGFPDEPFLLKMSRIYRDARRLHGQGPYKDHLWFCIRTGDQDWTGRPTFYFEIAPDYYSYGMGFWCPSKGETTPLLRPWYNRKSINLQHDVPLDDRIFSPELAQDVINGFRSLMPFYRYFDRLCASTAEA